MCTFRRTDLPSIQLAKRKADELEDFNAGMQRTLPVAFLSDRYNSNFTSPPSDRREIDADIPPEVVEEGSKLVEELLQAWVAQTSTSNGDAEDAMMVDGQEELSPEAQLEELKKCVERFRPQVEQNLWAQRVLESLG